jgi:hypothetical protein
MTHHDAGLETGILEPHKNKNIPLFNLELN